MKILKNILVSQSENKLRIADIYFTDKISEIKYQSNQVIDWKDIDTKEKLKKIIDTQKPTDTSGKEIIDGDYLLAIPGTIDPHVHFDTPGFEFRDDFEHASTAAAFGGVTTIIDMPCTSLPPVTSLQNFHTKLQAVEKRSLIDFAFWGGIEKSSFQNEKLLEKEIIKLADAGVAGFKVYTISGMDTFRDITYDEIEKAAFIVKLTGKPIAVHAEDKTIIFEKMQKFKSEGNNSYKAYCNSRNDDAEYIAVKEIGEIAEKTGCRFHIVHLSSEKALEEIKEKNKRIKNFTAETCPQYLYFTEKDFENEKIRNYLKTAPPVKHEKDKRALWDALINDDLIFVTTDHAGCNPSEEKSSDNFWDVYGGIPGIEHRVPFMFSEGFKSGILNLEQTIKLLTSNVADYFGINSKGYLQKDYEADIVLINLWNSEIVSSKNMHSKGKYTPFEGTVFNAIVEKTFLRGSLIMDRKSNYSGQTGIGKFIKI